MKLLRQTVRAGLCFLISITAFAQTVTPAQIEQFQQLPRAQQEALARQYGIDLDRLAPAGPASERPESVRVVEPLEDSEEKQRDDQAFEPDDARGRRDKNALEPFGYDLFAGRPTTFAPVTEIPVPANYTLGPGDVLKVQLWGKESRVVELPVSRDGTVAFPDSGPFVIAGLTFEEAREEIRERVSKQYIGVQASVSLGELRSIRVFVLGEARNPGSYSVSSLSTITNALYVSGGIKRSGSLRNVQLKRNGELVGTLDLYDLLLSGDNRGDQRLQAGDVIFIPPIKYQVGIVGEVHRPALYELSDEKTLEAAIRLAGGLTPQAYPQRIVIERTNDDFVRVLTGANLTTDAGRRTDVRSGDRITVSSISEVTGRYVEVKGAATHTGKYAWVPGMRISSVIRNPMADLLPAADTQYAAIVRTDPATDRISVLNVDLRVAVTRPGSAQDTLLQERDVLMVFADPAKQPEAALDRGAADRQNTNTTESGNGIQAVEREDHEPFDAYFRDALFEPVLQRIRSQSSPGRPQQTFSISGPVRFPGEYPMPQSGSLNEAIAMAGGLQDAASLYQAEVARYVVNEAALGETRIISVELAEVVSGNQDFVLQGRDRVLIKAIPEFAKTRTVTLQGEIRYPGEYTFRDGETLRDVLERAGGLTSNAFPKGAVFTREKLRQREAERLREAEKRLKGDLAGVQLEGGGVSGTSSQELLQAEKLLQEIQSSRPVGRMVIDLEAVLSDEGYQTIRLQDGDALTVPAIPQAVSVFGEVQFPTSHLHQAGLTVDDYIERSGGPTRLADEDRVYVVKADGSVMLPERSRWFGGRREQLEPGDTVVMPIDVDRLNQLELWTNVSQIVYQIALGAAAVGNL